MSIYRLIFHGLISMSFTFILVLLNMNSCNAYLIKDLILKCKSILVKPRTSESLYTYKCNFFNSLRYVLEADVNHNMKKVFTGNRCICKDR